MRPAAPCRGRIRAPINSAIRREDRVRHHATQYRPVSKVRLRRDDLTNVTRRVRWAHLLVWASAGGWRRGQGQNGPGGADGIGTGSSATMKRSSSTQSLFGLSLEGNVLFDLFSGQTTPCCAPSQVQDSGDTKMPESDTSAAAGCDEPTTVGNGVLTLLAWHSSLGSIGR